MPRDTLQLIVINCCSSIPFAQIVIKQTIASWGDPSSSQYHIQTDEGDERYFRYQTDSGQFRKEKRLADGTVTGTDAWIDGLGYLRQKDYVADNAGYRILRSKTVYVGPNTPIKVPTYYYLYRWSEECNRFRD